MKNIYNFYTFIHVFIRDYMYNYTCDYKVYFNK